MRYFNFVIVSWKCAHAPTATSSMIFAYDNEAGTFIDFDTSTVCATCTSNSKDVSVKCDYANKGMKKAVA